MEVEKFNKCDSLRENPTKVGNSNLAQARPSERNQPFLSKVLITIKIIFSDKNCDIFVFKTALKFEFFVLQNAA